MTSRAFPLADRAVTPTRLAATASVLATAVAVAALLSGSAQAHSFTAALVVAGEDREARLAEAVQGFLLAADERDGHANETSDGHLGGVDVQVLPLPQEAAGRVTGLVGTPDAAPEVVVVFGTAAAVGEVTETYGTGSVVLSPGTPPEGWEAELGDDSFAVRYRKAYGAAPSLTAALGYHAARRLDEAIRPLDGVSPRPALEAALQATEAGLPW